METKKRLVEFVKSRTYIPVDKRTDPKIICKENKMKGVFHQWGSEFEEGENEVASLTVGIIEDATGQIHTPIAKDVQFLDKN